jgi:transcriptional regulator with GAF, ATPase, and Fis domain
MLEALGEPSSSAMSLPLIVENRPVGALALIAEGDRRFDEHHVRLYATLKEPFFVAMSNTLEHEEVVQLRDRLADDNRQLQRDLLRISGDEIVGADFGLRDVMRKVRQVAPTESPVLLTGETGVGKDVIANAIHLASPRRDGPFIPVNCGAIPDTLLDSELFGHEKGAFTGALARKRGRFERSDGGTILLDEIGEMPPEAQVRLLRVIQHRGEPLRFDDLGGSLPRTATSDPTAEAGETLALDGVVARHVRRVLDLTGGKIHGPGGAGDLLGIDPNTLRYRMRKLGIPFRGRRRPR